MYGGEVIADSVASNGCRIVTVKATIWRPILAEVNTHRMGSRSAPSSRAISVEKLIKRIIDQPALPVWWGKRDGSGMQAREELSGSALEQVKYHWNEQMISNVSMAQNLMEHGLHQQITNRLLEPWMATTIIWTATSWANMFQQRCHEDAQPEFHEAADGIKAAIEASIPMELTYGSDLKSSWHLPFVTEEDIFDFNLSICQYLSVARCARASYFQFHGTKDIQKDKDLYDRLLSSSPPHRGPFEHQATPSGDHLFHGPYKGFKSYRLLTVQGEFVEDKLYHGPTRPKRGM